MPTAHFRISGESITEIARNLWIEGNYIKALSLLTEGVGLSEIQAAEVCTGKTKLVGDESCVNIEPDDVTETRGMLIPSVAQAFAKEMKKRRQAEDMNADYAEMALRETVLVGSPAGGRIIPRRKTKNNPSSLGPKRVPIVDDLDKLPVWRQIGGGVDTDIEPKPKNTCLDVKGMASSPEELIKAENEFKMIMNVVCPPEEVEYRAPDAAYAIDHESGWLSPDGRFYRCQYHEHRLLADALCGIMDYQKAPDGQGQEMLDEKGWVRLEGDGFIRKAAIEEGKRPATDKQLGMIVDWCVNNKLELPYWMKPEKE